MSEEITMIIRSYKSKDRLCNVQMKKDNKKSLKIYTENQLEQHQPHKMLLINVREYRRGNAIINGQYRETGNIIYTRRRKTSQKHNTICVGHHYTQTNTNKLNKTRFLLQTTGGKDEPNIVLKLVNHETPLQLHVPFYISNSFVLCFIV